MYGLGYLGSQPSCTMASFFKSWQLWQKMTFVLALAILAVFCAGFVKVMWTNRFVKRQRIVDEEKRAKIQELRKSGQFIEPRKSQDIPFGLRAIQSGVQVDGIWISGTRAPVRGSPKPGYGIGSSSESSETINHQSPDATSQHWTKGKPPKHTWSGVYGGSTHLPMLSQEEELGSTAEPPSSTKSAGYNTYKPRRSSYLRFGSYGETRYDEESLAQLEGAQNTKKQSNKKPNQESGKEDRDGDTSSGHGADNERSSSESDSSFHHASEEQPVQRAVRLSALQISPKVVVSSSYRAPLRAQFSHGDYVPVLVDDPLKSDRSAGPHRNPANGPSTANMTPRPRPSTEVPLLPRTHYTPAKPQWESFVPGELHLNRSSRVVNSGFEVLPAGTFGTPSAFTGHGDQIRLPQVEEERARREPGKLQKKGRTSMQTGRKSIQGESS